MAYAHRLAGGQRFRNLAVAEALRDALLPFKEIWLQELGNVGRAKLNEIDAYRRSN